MCAGCRRRRHHACAHQDLCQEGRGRGRGGVPLELRGREGERGRYSAKYRAALESAPWEMLGDPETLYSPKRDRDRPTAQHLSPRRARGASSNPSQPATPCTTCAAASSFSSSVRPSVRPPLPSPGFDMFSASWSKSEGKEEEEEEAAAAAND